MNRLNNAELARVVSRHFKMNESDPFPTMSSEVIPVVILEDFKHAHPQDTEVNRCVYDGLQASGVLAGQPMCFELYNPPNSGVIAELVSMIGSADQAGTYTLHLATTNTPNPHAGGFGIGKWLHLGSKGSISSGNSTLLDGYDANTSAAGNGGGGFISIRRMAANSFGELMVPGCPVFLVPGTAARMQFSTSTGATANWAAAWVERRLNELP